MSKLAKRRNNGTLDIFNYDENFLSIFDALTGILNPPGINVDALNTEMIENAENYVLQVEVPGINPEDVELTFDNGILDISCERLNESKSDQVHWQERSYGKLNRQFKTNNIDPSRISAVLEQGVLTVTLGKKQAPSLPAPTQIGIKSK